jgi:hypothetical protein
MHVHICECACMHITFCVLRIDLPALVYSYIPECIHMYIYIYIYIYAYIHIYIKIIACMKTDIAALCTCTPCAYTYTHKGTYIHTRMQAIQLMKAGFAILYACKPFANTHRKTCAYKSTRAGNTMHGGRRCCALYE